MTLGQAKIITEIGGHPAITISEGYDREEIRVSISGYTANGMHVYTREETLRDNKSFHESLSNAVQVCAILGLTRGNQGDPIGVVNA